MLPWNSGEDIMPIVVGISLRTAGKIYYFDPGTERYLHGEKVVVETARGQELGTVKIPPHDVPETQIVPPLKPVTRRANAMDVSRNAANREREEFSLNVCKRLVEKLNLPMRLIDAQYTLDSSHVLIHFLAENRVDFRELVRELARELHTRIELRQVGVRDEAKLIGGYGICGRKLCCSAFLGDFAPVAISMAKDQGLALNPQKISGSCGRLMCCLAFECDQYRSEKAGMPRLNATVETPQGVGKVTKLNVMSRQVEVMLPDAPAPLWFSADELGGKPLAVAAHCGQEACGGHCCSDELAEVAVLDEGDDELVYVEKTAIEVSHAELTFAAENSAVPVQTGEQDERARSRRRRRNKRPMNADRPPQQAGGTAPQGNAPSANESAAPGANPNRQRRRKPRPPRTDEATTAPQPNGPPSDDRSNVPPGRYKPRRRRRSSQPGGAAPPSES